MTQGRDGEALAYAERAKARALVDLLAGKSRFDGGRGAGRTELAGLVTALDELEEHKIGLLPSVGSAPPGIRGIVLQRTQIVETDPELASLVSAQPFDAAALQSALPPGETLVEYFGEGSRLFCFVMTRDETRALELDGEGLSEAVDQFRRELLRRTSTAYRSSAEALYARLLEPVEDLIHQSDLIIVPHGVLHYLPFGALHDGQQYALERYRIRILPSASVLNFLEGEAPDGTTGIMVLGNPDLGDPRWDLPFAEREASVIASRSSDALLLLRAQATETAIKKEARRFRVVHVAAHGIFEPEAPLPSGLLLARDSENDGRLTLTEVYDLQLNADLVMLSACETGLGHVSGGDDVVGFNRGLLYAGATSIVSSLWKVDDVVTARLMERLYQKLESMPVADALQEAQLEVMAEEALHPYFWAPFQVTGGGSGLQQF